MGTTAQKLQNIVDSKAAIKSTLSALHYQVGDVLSQWAYNIRNPRFSGDYHPYECFMGFGAKGSLPAQLTATAQYLITENVHFDDTVRFSNYSFAYAFQYAPITSIRLPSKIKAWTPTGTTSNNNILAFAFRNCTSLSTPVTLDLTEFFGADPSPSTLTGAFNSMFNECTSIPSVTLKLPDVWDGNWPTLNNFMNQSFKNCTGITQLDIYGVKYSINQAAADYTPFVSNQIWNGCTGIRTLTYHDVEQFGKTGANYSVSNGLGYFTNFTGVTTVYMPKLTYVNIGRQSSDFGAFYEIKDSVHDIYLPECNNVTACGLNPLTNSTTVHFATANEAAIEACAGYDVKFAPNGNPNIVFDL